MIWPPRLWLLLPSVSETHWKAPLGAAQTQEGERGGSGRVPVEAECSAVASGACHFPSPPTSWAAEPFHHSSVVALIREGPPEPSWATAGWWRARPAQGDPPVPGEVGLPRTCKRSPERSVHLKSQTLQRKSRKQLMAARGQDPSGASLRSQN